MYKLKQEPQDRIEEDRRHDQDTTLAMQEQSDTSCERQCFGDVVISAFREIEKSLDAEEGRVWIHVEANRTWLTIGCGAKVGGEQENGKRLKYQVEVAGQTMKSRLYQLTDSGPQKEYPIGDGHEIAGEAKGRNIADVTSKEIVDDFVATFEAYRSKKNNRIT